LSQSINAAAVAAVDSCSCRQIRTFASSATTTGGGSEDEEDEDELRLKFARVLRGYRKQNYGQELFSRFLKDLIAAADKNKDGVLSLQEVRDTLANIGKAGEIPDHELDAVWTGICKEGGGTVGSTPDETTVPIEGFTKIARNLSKRLDEEEKQQAKKNKS